ncbi:hypothetical protein ZIOFF_075832 [Zingiber officinale]|uniref:Uncharacterized protein n=1 Tax=Zingiber officinale TaxID=94328 RepID=A0A8J5CPT5_ZINOF|nr:hypothetical protein ZIOFF_075832 [Zingiber officinale]
MKQQAASSVVLCCAVFVLRPRSENDEPEQPRQEPEAGGEGERGRDAEQSPRRAVDSDGGRGGGVGVADELVRVVGGRREQVAGGGSAVAADDARRLPALPHVRHALREGPEVPQVQEHGAGRLPPRRQVVAAELVRMRRRTASQREFHGRLRSV